MRKGEEVRVQRKERIPSPSQTQALLDVQYQWEFCRAISARASFHFISVFISFLPVKEQNKVKH